MWGVSDPRKTRSGTVIGGGRGGRSRPRVSLTAADGRAHSDTGGTERRPLHRGEVAHSQRHRPVDLKSITFRPPRVPMESRAARRGNTAPESVFPPVFRQSKSNSRQPGDGIRVCGGEWECGYEKPCEPLRGRILTRVPPSSIDRSAPRLMSSRCASSALATMLTASSESRS